MTKVTARILTITYFTIISSSLTLFANTKIDSLKHLLQRSDQKTMLTTLDHLTNELLYVDNQEALTYAKEGLKLSQENKDTLEAVFYDYLGEIHRKLGNYDVAIEYLNKGLLLKQQFKNKKSIAISFNKIGKVNVNTGDYDLAIHNFMKALKLMEEIGDKEGQAFYLNNIGVVYDFQQMYSEALSFYEASLVLKKELKNEKGIASTTNNIAIVYFNLKNYQKSFEFHKAALELKIKTSKNQNNSIASSYNNVGYALLYLNRNEEAIKYLKKALELRQQLMDKPGIARSWNNLAMAYLNLSNYSLADKYGLEGLEIAEELGSKELIKNSYLTLSEIAEKRDNHKLSLAYYKKYTNIKDSLLTLSNSEILAEVEAKYQNKKKEVELKNQEIVIEQKNLELEKEANHRKLILLILIGALFTLSLSIVGYFQKRRISILLKAQNLLVENKNKALAKYNEIINLELEDKNAILNKVYTEKTKTELPQELLSLSQREMEVLSILALGWSDQQIADKLFISKATVKSHLRNIYSKLLVKSRTEAVSIAHKYNIIGTREA